MNNKKIVLSDELLNGILSMLKKALPVDSITVFKITDSLQWITTIKSKKYKRWIDSLSDDYVNHIHEFYQDFAIYYNVIEYEEYITVLTQATPFLKQDKDTLATMFEILYKFNDFQTQKNDVYLFKNILNRIQANVCISDPFTNKIIYMNDYMKDKYQVEKPEGQICWNILRKNQDHRCDNCPIPYLREYPDEIYKCENINPFNQTTYRSYDYIIQTIDGEMAHFQYSIDITDTNKVRIDASFDTLTGILNRKHGFEVILDQLLKAKEKMKDIHICMLDVNHLKQVNDSYGHHEGDLMLKTITQAIKDKIEPWDVFMRLSGDEFIVTFYDCSIDYVKLTLDNILHKLSYQATSGYDISFCYGIYTVSPTNELSLEEIISKADERMYQQKRNSI